MKRRNFIKGAGGIIFGLPFLESLVPTGILRAETVLDMAPQPYAIFFRSAHGFVRNRFWPTTHGKLTAATLKGRALETLTPYADRMQILEGISHPFGSNGCDHKYGGIQALTGAKPYRAENEGVNLAVSLGESIDFRIQRSLMPGTEPLILTSGKKNTDTLGVQDFVSFRGPKDLVAGEFSPFNAYKRTFGMSGNTGPSDARQLLRKSVNDFVKEEIKAIASSKALAQSDKERIQLHLDSVRDLEKKLALKLPDERITQLEKGSNVSSYENNTIEVIKMQLDVIAVSIAAGAFRSITFQIGAGIDATEYTIGGVKYRGAHAISHRVATQKPFMDGDKLEGAEDMHHALDKMHADLYKYLLDQLSSYKFGMKSLLDYGSVLWFSEIGDGPSHDHNNIPHIIAGSANGVLRNGEFVKANAHVNKVLNSIGASVGLKNGTQPLNNFGDSGLVAENKNNMSAGLLTELSK